MSLFKLQHSDVGKGIQRESEGVQTAAGAETAVIKH